MTTYRILGMMSGTSLDGLDLCLAALTNHDGMWEYEILAADCLSYDTAMRDRLEAAIRLPAPDLLAFHAEYGDWLGRQARAFLTGAGLEADCIASHGHTIHHRPEQGFTFQLGSPQHLALAAALPVVGDFRSLDVALGGQGAPLVPVGDRLLFGNYNFCLNLGGISNISFEQDGKRIAFDIGIANMLLNHLSRMAGKAYDPDGGLARTGQVNPGLLEALDRLPYYGEPFPKSTGYEWFEAAIIPLIMANSDAVPNLLQTAVRHIAGQVAAQVGSLSGGGAATVLATGGGVHNSYLMEEIRLLSGSLITYHIPDPEIINFKEALVFALLGALRLSGQTNVLASVTGARRDSCSGVLFNP